MFTIQESIGTENRINYCDNRHLIKWRFFYTKTYVNVIMSDNLDEMKRLRDFLAQHHITNVAADSYTLNWNSKTITITAYPETKAESRLINKFIDESDTKFKRVIQPV